MKRKINLIAMITCALSTSSSVYAFQYDTVSKTMKESADSVESIQFYSNNLKGTLSEDLNSRLQEAEQRVIDRKIDVSKATSSVDLDAATTFNELQQANEFTNNSVKTLREEMKSSLSNAGSGGVLTANATPSALDKEIYNYMKSKGGITFRASQRGTTKKSTSSMTIKGGYGIYGTLYGNASVYRTSGWMTTKTLKNYYTKLHIVKEDLKVYNLHTVYGADRNEFYINGKREAYQTAGSRVVNYGSGIIFSVKDATKLRYNPYRAELGLTLLPE